MSLAESKLTRQGQVSVPASIRRKLGLAPGSVLEWYENDQGDVVVRRAGKFSSQEIRQVLFAETPSAKSAAEMNEGIKRHLPKKYARD
jgi:antitoxin PrlF